MQSSPPRRRRLVASASIATTIALAVAGIAGLPAQAATSRTASTSVDTSYLSDTLGLATDTVIESVTYDRFQWLLQQPGQYAFLIGSATDGNFAGQARKVDAAAKAAGAAKVYWFDPNLSGYSGTRNLDIRNPSGINLGAASQAIYGRIWTNLIGQYLGNGYKSVPNASKTTVTVTQDDSIVNDADDPAFDFRTGKSQAIGVSDNAFLVYDKDHTVVGDATTKDTIVDWVDLSTDAAPDTALPAAFAAAGGGAVIDQLSQFAWWKDSANSKHNLSYADDARYGGDILDDSDDAEGWRVQQITYPQLIHLLALNQSGANFVILFGGTWCHNTRAVIKDVNADAQKNGVTTVYNFDLVLDGGTVNGTNGSSNPIHVRDNANNGTTFNYRPSYLYGDVVRTYLKNLVTEYDPNTGTAVSYYPGGDTSVFPSVVRKLQVPFLINYERGTGTSPSSTAIKRQWIQQSVADNTGLATFKEYMSEWWYTHPSAQLGLSFAIPADESTLTDDQKLQLANARSNAAFGAEAVERLGYFFGGLPGGVVSTQSVTAPQVAYGADPTVTVAIANDYGRIASGTATLSVAGASYTEDVSQNSAVFTVARLTPGTYPYTVSYAGDDQILGFAKTGDLVVTKAAVSSIGVTTVTAPTTTKPGSVEVRVAVPAGLDAASGTVSLSATKGASSVSATGTLSSGAVRIALPALAAGTWNVSASYSGDSRYEQSSTAAGTVVSAKSAVAKLAGSVSTAPTTKKAGRYAVTVKTAKGAVAASGTVTLTVTKGSVTKKVTAKLSKGKASATLSKLARGTWKVSLAYAGNGVYKSAKAKGASVTVKK